MSASWSKKIVVLPTLPPELWLHIFDFATHVPHLFDSEVQNPFSSSPSSPTYPDYASDEKFRQAVRAALVTKRYLVRVCKQWHALATPLLYAAIYIGWERHLPQLRDTLTADADRARADTSGAGAQPKGWWTRRVDLAMRAGRTSAEQWAPAPETHSTALLQLIRCFPNLEILSALWDNSFLMQSGPRFQAELALALRHTSAHALRKLVWPNVCDVVNGLTALRTVGSIPDLIVFPCPLAAAFPPSLSYLWLAGDYSCALPHVHPAPLPALRQISVHDHHLVEFPCLADFLAIQGPRLETVRVHLHTDRPDGLGALLRALCDACTNLRHLVLSMDRRWEELDVLGAGDRAVMPGVTHLGLRLPNQGRNVEYRRVFEWLDALKERAEALRIVRFLNSSGWMDLKTRHRRVFLEGLAGLTRRNVRVEDPAGREIVFAEIATPSEVQQIVGEDRAEDDAPALEEAPATEEGPAVQLDS